MGSTGAAQLGTTSCQDDQNYPALGLMAGSPHILTIIQSVHSNRARPGLSELLGFTIGMSYLTS